MSLKCRLRGNSHGADGQKAADRLEELEGVINYLMQQFEGEVWVCPSCGHEESTATMDSADYLRRFLKDRKK